MDKYEVGLGLSLVDRGQERKKSWLRISRVFEIRAPSGSTQQEPLESYSGGARFESRTGRVIS
jgi:hypothetical protein